jgi:hypothetical protein
VRGTAARTLAGHVTIIVHYALGIRGYNVQKTVRVADGRWAAVLELPSGARTRRVTVLYHRSAHWVAETVTRYVHHAPNGAGH